MTIWLTVIGMALVTYALPCASLRAGGGADRHLGARARAVAGI